MTTTGKAGMAWYKEEDYPKLRALFVDGDEFPEFYDEWLDSAEEDEQRAIARGVELVRIAVEPDAFSAWCKLKELCPDAATRKKYARHGALLGRPPKD
jgi:hypothetical protein